MSTNFSSCIKGTGCGLPTAHDESLSEGASRDIVGQIFFVFSRAQFQLLCMFRFSFCPINFFGFGNQKEPEDMMRLSKTWLHGPLTYRLGSGSLRIGRDLQAMTPSNSIYYDPAKLRHRLDKEGYLYFKNVIPKVAVNQAYDEIAVQMLNCGWTTSKDRELQAERDGFAFGIPFPSVDKLPPPAFGLTDAIKTAVCGTNVMTVARQVFGGAVTLLPHHSLELSPPDEEHGFRSSSVFMNRGTKLSLIAWVPLHDIPLNMGGLCVVKGSNTAAQFSRIRETYGNIDVETSGIRGDGCYTNDPHELLPLGKRADIDDHSGKPIVVDDTPMVSTTFESGDLVLMTVYTMYSFLTNNTNCWRVSAETRWIMEGDDVGPDPRYWGDNPEGLSKWLSERDNLSKYPKSMAQAKREWGLIPDVKE